MAVIAAVAATDVNLVTECYRFDVLLSGKVVTYRLEDRVALLAVFLDRESVLAVMTGSAGLPFFHFIHGVATVTVTRDEGLVVAVVAAVDCDMELVTEKSTGVPETDLLDRMTFVAGPFYGKSGLAVMAGSTGIAALHLCHVETPDHAAGRENTVMAFVTFVKSGMELVTENDRSGLLDLDPYLLGRHVATVAVTLDGERKDAVMAGAAGAVLLHFRHGVTYVFTVWGKESIVTVTAAVHFEMPLVGKHGIGLEENILYRMAFAALPCH